MSEPARIGSFGEFWPFYLTQHAKPATRAWHIAGTGFSTVLLAVAALRLDGVLLLLAIAAGYGPAWMAHFFIEKNRPATFRYPLWSLACDFRMVAAWLSGGLPRELKKAGIG